MFCDVWYSSLSDREELEVVEAIHLYTSARLRSLRLSLEVSFLYAYLLDLLRFHSCRHSSLLLVFPVATFVAVTRLCKAAVV